MFGFDKNGYRGRSDGHWLSRLANDPKAKYDLEEGGLNALPVLMKALQDDRETVRCEAASCLNGMADKSVTLREQLPEITARSKQALREMVSSEVSTEARWLAVCALKKLPLPDAEKLSIFTPALRDPFEKIRVVAIYALAQLGEAAAPAAAAAVCKLFTEEQESKYVLEKCREALMAMGREFTIPAVKAVAATGNLRAESMLNLLELDEDQLDELMRRRTWRSMTDP